MRVIIFLLLAILVGALQVSGLAFFGVKPNFVLAFSVAAAFYLKDFLWFAIVVLVSLLMVRSQAAFQWEPIVVFGLALLVFWSKSYWPWKEFINWSAALLSTSVLFYLIIDPRFIFVHYSILGLEILYNLILGGLLLLLLPRNTVKNEE